MPVSNPASDTLKTMLTLTITIAETNHNGQEVLELSSKGTSNMISDKEDLIGRLTLAFVRRLVSDIADSRPVIVGGRPENG